MNILKRLVTTVEEKTITKNVFGEETFIFKWNHPATEEDIKAFENRNQCSLPVDLKEFLLVSNGATLFKSEQEDEECKAFEKYYEL